MNLQTFNASNEVRQLEVPNGLYFTVSADGLASDSIEIRADAGLATTPFNIADSTDPIDTSKKVVNAANNIRSIRGPLTVSLHRIGTADSNLKVYVSIQ